MTKQNITRLNALLNEGYSLRKVILLMTNKAAFENAIINYSRAVGIAKSDLAELGLNVDESYKEEGILENIKQLLVTFEKDRYKHGQQE